MKVKRILSWFATENGRKATFSGVFVAGISAFSVNFLPHTLLLDYYKDIVQMYRGGEGVPVPTKVLSRAEEAIEILEVSPFERKFIKFFTVYGFDSFFAGSSSMKNGIYIGIPSHFSCEKVGDIQRQLITVKGEPVAWDSKAGKELLNSLVLSDAAQKFAIATNINQARSNHVVINSSSAIVCCWSAYTFSHALNKKLDTFKKPLLLRFTLYSLVGLFMTGLWAMLKDMSTQSLENKVDHDVASISPELANGGLELYSKVLKRNIALRELMGSDGENIYSSSGNNQVFIRTKHVPITQRRDNLAEIVKKNSSMKPV